MRSASRTPPVGGAYSRRFSRYAGLFFDDFDPASAWIRETAAIELPPLGDVQELKITGEFRAHPQAHGVEAGAPALDVFVDGRPAGTIAPTQPGPWALRLPVPGDRPVALSFRLRHVSLTNSLAWLGRVTGFGPWQRFRAQNKNRQLRIAAIATGAGETIFDFSRRDAPYSAAFARRHAKLGLNIVGFLTADLGVGESARCMVRAADAAGLATALVPLAAPSAHRRHCSTRPSRPRCCRRPSHGSCCHRSSAPC